MKLEKDKCRNAVSKWLLDYHIYIYICTYMYIYVKEAFQNFHQCAYNNLIIILSKKQDLKD